MSTQQYHPPHQYHTSQRANNGSLGDGGGKEARRSETVAGADFCTDTPRPVRGVLSSRASTGEPADLHVEDFNDADEVDLAVASMLRRLTEVFDASPRKSLKERAVQYLEALESGVIAHSKAEPSVVQRLREFRGQLASAITIFELCAILSRYEPIAIPTPLLRWVKRNVNVKAYQSAETLELLVDEMMDHILLPSEYHKAAPTTAAGDSLITVSEFRNRISHLKPQSRKAAVLLTRLLALGEFRLFRQAVASLLRFCESVRLQLAKLVRQSQGQPRVARRATRSKSGFGAVDTALAGAENNENEALDCVAAFIKLFDGWVDDYGGFAVLDVDAHAPAESATSEIAFAAVENLRSRLLAAPQTLAALCRPKSATGAVESHSSIYSMTRVIFSLVTSLLLNDGPSADIAIRQVSEDLVIEHFVYSVFWRGQNSLDDLCALAPTATIMDGWSACSFLFLGWEKANPEAANSESLLPWQRAIPHILAGRLDGLVEEFDEEESDSVSLGHWQWPFLFDLLSDDRKIPPEVPYRSIEQYRNWLSTLSHPIYRIVSEEVHAVRMMMPSAADRVQISESCDGGNSEDGEQTVNSNFCGEQETSRTEGVQSFADWMARDELQLDELEELCSLSPPRRAEIFAEKENEILRAMTRMLHRGEWTDAILFALRAAGLRLQMNANDRQHGRPVSWLLDQMAAVATPPSNAAAATTLSNSASAITATTNSGCDVLLRLFSHFEVRRLFLSQQPQWLQSGRYRFYMTYGAVRATLLRMKQIVDSNETYAVKTAAIKNSSVDMQEAASSCLYLAYSGCVPAEFLPDVLSFIRVIFDCAVPLVTQDELQRFSGFWVELRENSHAMREWVRWSDDAVCAFEESRLKAVLSMTPSPTGAAHRIGSSSSSSLRYLESAASLVPTRPSSPRIID